MKESPHPLRRVTKAGEGPRAAFDMEPARPHALGVSDVVRGGQEREGLLSAFLQRRRLAAAAPQPRGRVFDVGCGATGALAARCNPESYLGFDIDPGKVASARAHQPAFTFTTAWPSGERFDTVVALAVVEHVADPSRFLRELASVLARGGRIVLTTPKPRYRGLHELGARLRLFSREAAEEHQAMLGPPEMRAAAEQAGLRIVAIRPFLAGANQLFVLEP